MSVSPIIKETDRQVTWFPPDVFYTLGQSTLSFYNCFYKVKTVVSLSRYYENGTKVQVYTRIQL